MNEIERSRSEIIDLAIKRAEYFFPGDPTIEHVHGALRTGEADVTALRRLAEMIVDIARATTTTPSPFVPPYDVELDRLLQRRGWWSRRTERTDDHTYDFWIWPPSRRFAHPTMIHHEGRQLRAFYPMSPLVAPTPELTFMDADELLKQIHWIEAWGSQH